MFKNFKTKNKLQKGFTIIEVMIVLAIAGLILVVVLIAIPQLQRNQRNSARQSNLSRMTTEIQNFAGNNNGRIPGTTPVEISEFYERYLADINIEDPSTGVNMPIVVRTTAVGSVPDLNGAIATITTTPFDADGDSETPDVSLPTGTSGGDVGVAYYQTGVSCDGETIATGSQRNFALYGALEGGAIYCLDNK